MKHILSIVVSVLLLHPILQNPVSDANQWWAEAVTLAEKAASLKKARYDANQTLKGKLRDQARQEWQSKNFTSTYEMYEELVQKAAPEFAAIQNKYDPQITTALQQYVAFLQTRKQDDAPILAASKEIRPKVLYQEKASYTEAARRNRVQGIVLLNMIFGADGRISNIRVVRTLPDGLEDEAIKAAREIVFLPALKDGQPVSVRLSVEYSFNLL